MLSAMAAAGRARKVALGLLVIVALLIVPSIAALQWLARSHSAFEQALHVIQSSDDVARRLGTPIETGFWVSGKSWRGSAGLEFVIAGPRGRADVSVTAKLEDGRWHLTRLLWRPGDRWQTIAVSAE